jgi:predicted nucleotidyltransferase
MSDFKNGTIFAKIIEINNEMASKLETKVDLRTENCTPGENGS